MLTVRIVLDQSKCSLLNVQFVLKLRFVLIVGYSNCPLLTLVSTMNILKNTSALATADCVYTAA